MNQKKIIAILFLVIGTGLLIWGFQMSDSINSKLSQTITGALPDKVMWHYISGAVCIVLGAVLLKK